MGIKDYINHKRATALMKRAKNMLGSMWEMRIVEAPDYDNKIEKTLIIEVKEYWFKPDEFAKFLEVLMKECVKYKLHFWGNRDDLFGIELKVKW